MGLARELKLYPEGSFWRFLIRDSLETWRPGATGSVVRSGPVLGVTLEFWWVPLPSLPTFPDTIRVSSFGLRVPPCVLGVGAWLFPHFPPKKGHGAFFSFGIFLLDGKELGISKRENQKYFPAGQPASASYIYMNVCFQKDRSLPDFSWLILRFWRLLTNSGFEKQAKLKHEWIMQGVHFGDVSFLAAVLWPTNRS